VAYWAVDNLTNLDEGRQFIAVKHATFERYRGSSAKKSANGVIAEGAILSISNGDVALPTSALNHQVEIFA
jgi:hypothetical protein